MICTDIPPPEYLIFSDTVPQLLYYSHIPTAIITLFIGLFVFLKSKNLLSALLLLISSTFTIWLFINLLSWTSVNGDLIMFNSSLFGILNIVLFFSFLYFYIFYIRRCDVHYFYKILLSLLLLPVILFSQYNFSVFNLTYCEVFDTVGVYSDYIYILELLVFITILLFGGYSYIRSKEELREQILLITFGVGSFLFLFFTTGYFASYLNEMGFNNAFEIEQYGLFGMTFFIGVLSYLIVKFHAFNIKLAAAQALVVALIFITGSELFFVESLTNYILVSITLIFSIIGGYFLVRSVKREIAQREEIAQLADTLAKANERLKILDKMKSEFVSIASHQLRSPLTSIRGYASMLAEGSYGKLPEKAQEVASSIAESSKFMAMSIEDYLNVSRIEAGNMKYEMSDFSLKDVAGKVVDELRPTAMKKGLVMVFRSDCTTQGTIHADIGKTRQIIMNLVDNSMKYTPKGTVTVIAHDDVKKKKMYVTIQDTGIGMSKETLEEVFDKFVRAKNANSVNVTGTGLGLFVAKKMVTEMKGKVWAESEGEGKGSRFIVEFPLISGDASGK